MTSQPLMGSTHSVFTVPNQRNVEAHIRKDMRVRRSLVPKHELKRLKTGTSESSHHELENSFFDSLNPLAKSSQLVSILRARRQAEQDAFGYQDFAPRPCVRLTRARPDTPEREASQEWQKAAHRLERPAALRVLHQLQERLKKEVHSREVMEDQLALRMPQMSRSLSDLSFHDSSLAHSAARTHGLFPEGCAGRFVEMRETDKIPKQRRPHNRTRPKSTGPYPMATH
mmetsp:Transcript_155318/g.270336  ORF Transcript_155318/g.270336 Transcript_155318/m.270336 type:complete len:228 (-) Transcript_155318:41-724(-)